MFSKYLSVVLIFFMPLWVGASKNWWDADPEQLDLFESQWDTYKNGIKVYQVCILNRPRPRPHEEDLATIPVLIEREALLSYLRRDGEGALPVVLKDLQNTSYVLVSSPAKKDLVMPVVIEREALLNRLKETGGSIELTAGILGGDHGHHVPDHVHVFVSVEREALLSYLEGSGPDILHSFIEKDTLLSVIEDLQQRAQQAEIASS